jgi:hypothetical protein
MGTPDSSAAGAQWSLEFQCPVVTDEAARFGVLVQEMAVLAAIPNPEHLRRIVVVPEGQLPAAVNAIQSQGASSKAVYKPGEYAPKGVVVPAERNGQLACEIVFDERVLQGLSSPGYPPNDTVSTVLEELLHIWVYSSVWNMEKSSPPGSSWIAGNEVQVVCMNAHGEYMANRRKSFLYASRPLFAVEGGFITAYIVYPEPLGPVLENARTHLVSIITKAAGGTLSNADGWDQLLTCVYREVVEPLCRESAKREGCVDARETGSPNTDEEIGAREPSTSTSRFFRVHVAPYWARMHAELERSYTTFDTHPLETLAALASLRAVLDEFLAHLGVTYRALPNGQIYAYFDGTRALSLRS